MKMPAEGSFSGRFLYYLKLRTGGITIVAGIFHLSPLQQALQLDHCAPLPFGDSAIGKKTVLLPEARVHSTITSVPAVSRIAPMRDLAVNCSCRNTKASTRVMTMLILSMGATLLTSPSCKAR